MPLTLIKNLQKVAQEKDVSLNYLVTCCCEYALNDMKNPKTEEIN
jgi:hypothetical protein